MGTDIHMFIAAIDGEMIERDIFDGRNYEWFEQLREGYLNLPTWSGIPDISPEEVCKDFYNHDANYFSFHHMTTKDFADWYMRVQPNKDAYWMDTYTKYLYEVKGVYPDTDGLYHYLTENDIIEDMHFVEIENPNNCFTWLYNFLIDKLIPFDNDTYIIFYFDN